VADLRVDPLSGRLVAIAPGRAGRPGAHAARIDPQTDEELETCPFCEGREDQTPPEVLVVPQVAGREPNTPGWSVRVVPNKYPAFARPEVVVHSPRHVRSLAELDRPQLELVAEAWRLRAAAAAAEGKVLFAGVNEGRAAGASLPHSHSQIVTLDEEPPIPRAERDAGCRLCELLERELADETRVVAEVDGLVLLCPYASRAPYECLVAPVEHDANGFGPRLGAALELGARVLGRLAELDAPRPANLWLHEAGHWHLELLPRLNVFAAFELGAGHYINTLAPEAAAADLRT
jgi:UDPglucose--hexose-1-phosphate uridylyltransferase